VLQLEKDRERLNKKLRVKALERGQRAVQLGVSVEKLTALEEMEAELDKDSAFDGYGVGAARLQPAAAQAASKEAPISLEFAGVSDVRVLQQRGSAVQTELAKKTAELQAAEAARRKVEREKASLLQDREALYEQVDLLKSTGDPLAPQNAMLRSTLDEFRGAIRQMAEEVREATSAGNAAAAAEEGAADAARQARRGKASGLSASTGAMDRAQAKAVGADVALMLASLQSQLDERIQAVDAEISASMADGGARRDSVTTAGTPAKRGPRLSAEAEAGTGGRTPSKVDGVEFASREQDALKAAKAAEAARARQEREARLKALEAGAADSPQDAIIELPAELAESEVDSQLLLAAMNAQLLEATAALAQRQQECERMGREVHAYASTFERMHQQQTSAHRETRTLAAPESVPA
jgi:hypothetical protein